jgi:hypothetical protein
MADGLEDFSDGLTSFINSGFSSQSGQNGTIKDFQRDGFIVPSTPSADGNGLPSFNKTKGKRKSERKRNLIHWFLPEFGIVKMYVNPNTLRYTYRKSITQERTKNGFNLQYWGEELPTIALSGTTGSSGIEGINILYEVYRAEQYAFDGIGLTLAAENFTKSQSGSLTSLIKDELASTIVDGVFGVGNSSNSLASRKIPTIAEFAFGVEMFYQGWVHRGFFTSMTITEKEVGLFDYNMEFTSIQRRGYRLNNMAWQRDPTSGYSDSGSGNFSY